MKNFPIHTPLFVSLFYFQTQKIETLKQSNHSCKQAQKATYTKECVFQICYVDLDS